MRQRRRPARTAARGPKGGRGEALYRRAELLVPPSARAHLRAAIREGVLALASLCEAALKVVEGSARGTRQRIKRIPVKGRR